MKPHTHTQHTGIFVIKKKEIMPFAATWKDLETIPSAKRQKTNVINVDSVIPMNLLERMQEQKHNNKHIHTSTYKIGE